MRVINTNILTKVSVDTLVALPHNTPQDVVDRHKASTSLIENYVGKVLRQERLEQTIEFEAEYETMQPIVILRTPFDQLSITDAMNGKSLDFGVAGFNVHPTNGRCWAWQVVCTYIAGYTTDNMPSPIIEANQRLVMRLQDVGNDSLQSVKLGSMDLPFTNKPPLDFKIKTLLDPYRTITI